MIEARTTHESRPSQPTSQPVTMNVPASPLTETPDISVSAPRRAAGAIREFTSVFRPHLAWLLSRRQDRPWLALVAVPLALTAAVAAIQLWLIPPLLLLCWWWSPPAFSWISVVAAALEACLGVQWVYLGVDAIGSFPHRLIVVGIVWALYAAVIAGAGVLNRRRLLRRAGW
jgi:hypothetical protein